MKKQFCDNIGLNKGNQEKLRVINSIIEEFQAQGYTLTLRQLYYQLVSRDHIPNQQKEYAKLSRILTKGRMAGIVDWSAIEDRVRVPYIPYWSYDVADALNDTITQYRRDRQSGQDKYIEVWCEKDALSGVLKRITSFYHVHLMINRGYSSCSAMYDSAERFRTEMNIGKDCIILYMGDHDPSGLDMIRDIKKRLDEFGVCVDVEHLALTTEQVETYNPPPNPAKFSDPRAGWYVKEHGRTSWEVDALRPDTLTELIKNSIENIIDTSAFMEVLALEKSDKQRLKQISEDFQ